MCVFVRERRRERFCKITDVQTEQSKEETACGRKGTGVHLYMPPVCEFMHPRKSVCVCAAVCDSLSAAQQVCAAVSTG